MPTKETCAALVGLHEDEALTPPHQNTDLPVIKRRKKKSPLINMSDEHEEALPEWM